MLVLGLCYICLGADTERYLGKPSKPSALAWIIMIVMLGGGLVLEWWLKATLRGYGYQ
jgi:hypothetical protein